MKLSKDYKRLFELVYKKNYEIPCYVDYNKELGIRDIAQVKKRNNGTLYISARGICYMYFFTDQCKENLFCKKCEEINLVFIEPIESYTLQELEKRVEVLEMALSRFDDWWCEDCPEICQYRNDDCQFGDCKTPTGQQGMAYVEMYIKQAEQQLRSGEK